MSERIDRYKRAKKERLEGKFNGAPLYYSFPRLGEVVPVLPKGKQIMFLGGSGVGKSNMWVGTILMPIYNLIKNYGYKAKFHIFLLEDPKELLEDRLFCRVLYMMSKKKIEIDPVELNSMKKNPVSDEVEAMFEQVDKVVEDILSHCVIHESVFHCTGIYKTLRTESAEQGEHIWETREFEYKKKDGSTYKEPVKVYKEYKPNEEYKDVHNIVIVDNLNNFAEEYDSKLKKNLDLRGSINKWCRDYARLQICKHWNWTVIDIMQSALEADRKQFDLMRGKQVIEKVEPNLSSLGDSKVVSRDMHLIFGIFSPARFGIENYEGYDITKLDDNFRALIVLKTNFGIPNLKIPLLFKGAVTYYEELPSYKDIKYDKFK